MHCSKPSRFVRNSGTKNALTSYLVCKTMSCDENSFKHTNKQAVPPFRSENETDSLFQFLFHRSKFDSRRLNQCWKTLLSFVVEAENLRVQPV